MKSFFRKILKNIRNYKLKDLSIKYKFFLCLAFMILFMITLYIIIFSFFKKDKSNTTISIVNQMNFQAMTEIDSYVQDISNLTKNPLFYDNNNIIKNLDISNNDSYSFFNSQNELNYIIENMFSLKKNIHSVFIFNLKGQNIFTIKNGELHSNYIPIDEEWFKKSIEQQGQPIVIPTHLLPNVKSNNNKPCYVFSAARGLVRYEGAKVVGVILINGSTDVLSNMMHKLLIYPGQRIIVINKSGYVIYDTKESNITKYIQDDLEDLNSDYESKQIKINNVDSLVTSEYSQLTDWRLINIIPTSSLNKSINVMKFRTSMITAIFVILACLIFSIIMKQILNPIKKLSMVMKIVEKGDFDVKVNVNNNDEIGILSKTFNSMTLKTKELIDEVYISKIKQKELELKMLQNQINPHFIYNTLESIHMMAEINNDKETSNMAMKFGSILRYSLSNKIQNVTVRDEITNLESYVMLQKIRYDNIDKFSFDIEERIYNVEIIKLIFQPIVENAIYHGLNNTEEGGEITILGYKKDNDAIFEITDNGQGMEDTQVILLNDYINEQNDMFKSIGLKNVNMRIKFHYGPNYGISIFSKIGVGTTVKVTIPYDTEKDIN